MEVRASQLKRSGDLDNGWADRVGECEDGYVMVWVIFNPDRLRCYPGSVLDKKANKITVTLRLLNDVRGCESHGAITQQ